MEISGLFRYPVKSCAGESLDVMQLGPYGPVDDRSWMIVDPDGVFFSQRKDPRMALIAPELVDGGIVLRAPEMPDLSVERPNAKANRNVSVHASEMTAADCDPRATEWLSDYLGKPAALVSLASDHFRQVNPEYAPQGRETGFADGYPLLIATEESLADLVANSTSPFPMNRFRPNIVVRGAQPWEEDTWEQIAAGEAIITTSKVCARCPIPNVVQETGLREKEPAKVLAKMRRRESDGKTLFGVNVYHEPLDAVLRIGDAVRTLSLV